eukprot:CAMPEP_0201567640 /NCGR_PEP_ID=MMETSP0190_2-20130828/8218_1 /ASSEMBLY_ACC=CAM_ASM_000263 /TAXON_ID=37353 /ORGANISM="Rosalina sp." /LENGTH=125 /DNA_ID=CAMNT_0047987855 /DNA_START=254 /DNA_END=631 /DNA_ORIENTATION=+
MAHVSRSVSSAWRALTPVDKSKYQESYANDRTKYKDAMKRYKESGRANIWLDKILKLAEEKPPKSGYQLFIKKRMPQNHEKQPNAQIKDIMKLTASEWKTLNAEQKKPWNDKAKAAFAEWEKKFA